MLIAVEQTLVPRTPPKAPKSPKGAKGKKPPKAAAEVAPKPPVPYVPRVGVRIVTADGDIVPPPARPEKGSVRDVIFYLRAKYGLSQAALARLTGGRRSKQSINYYESDLKRQFLLPPVIKDLTDAFRKAGATEEDLDLLNPYGRDDAERQGASHAKIEQLEELAAKQDKISADLESMKVALHAILRRLQQMSKPE
jgi:transcriptional regulator with XRE-family HTH domain